MDNILESRYFFHKFDKKTIIPNEQLPILRFSLSGFLEKNNITQSEINFQIWLNEFFEEYGPVEATQTLINVFSKDLESGRKITVEEIDKMKKALVLGVIYTKIFDNTIDIKPVFDVFKEIKIREKTSY